GQLKLLNPGRCGIFRVEHRDQIAGRPPDARPVRHEAERDSGPVLPFPAIDGVQEQAALQTFNRRTDTSLPLRTYGVWTTQKSGSGIHAEAPCFPHVTLKKPLGPLNPQAILYAGWLLQGCFPRPPELFITWSQAKRLGPHRECRSL